MSTHLRVLETIEEAGAKAWIAGDPVRELMMGIQPSSMSVVCEPCDLDALSVTLGGTVSGPEGHLWLHTSILGMNVSITCLKTLSIEEELSQRDFTINAMAIRGDGAIVDPFNGRQDIRNRLIRLTDDNTALLGKEPIRVVRMLRFAAELNMDIFWKSDTDVRTFLSRDAEKLKEIPPERWGHEILNCMRRRPYDFIFLCDKYRLFPFFLVEMENLKQIRIGQGRTLFDHCLDGLRILQDYLTSRKRRFTDVAFSMGVLFHHFGAVQDQPTDMAKTVEITRRYLHGWNMNADIIDMVVELIENYHALNTPVSQERMCAVGLMYGFDLLRLFTNFAIYNSMANGMKNIDVITANRWTLREIIWRFDRVRRKTGNSMRYLSGSEVIDLLKITESKAVGDTLYELDMAVGTGKVGSREGAVKWVQEHAAN